MNEVFRKIGELLKQERLRRKLEIDTVANELKISSTNLAAVEDGEVSKLPAELYFSLFAKSYAHHLGIDYQRTVEAIKEEIGYREPVTNPALTESSESSVDRTIPRDDNSKIAWFVGIAAVLVIGLLAGGAYWIFGKGSSDTVAEESVEPEPSVEQSTIADSLTLGGTFMPADSATGLTLSLMARVQSFGLVIADGVTKLSGDMQIGHDYPFVAKDRFIISLGTPEAVDVRVNGLKAELADPRNKRVSHVEITPTNFKSFLVADVVSDSLSPMKQTIGSRQHGDTSMALNLPANTNGKNTQSTGPQ